MTLASGGGVCMPEAQYQALLERAEGEPLFWPLSYRIINTVF